MALTCHRRGKDRGGSRQNGGGGGDNQPGTSGRDGREHHRGNGADTGRGGGRGTPSGGGVRRGDPLGRPADAAVLRGAAAALNEYSSDGSFLERFKGSAEAAAAGAMQSPPQICRYQLNLAHLLCIFFAGDAALLSRILMKPICSLPV